MQHQPAVVITALLLHTCQEVVHDTPQPEVRAHICLPLAHKLQRQCVLPSGQSSLQSIPNSALHAWNLQQEALEA